MFGCFQAGYKLGKVKKLYAAMQNLSQQLEEEQEHLEKSFVSSLKEDERSAYEKEIEEMQKSQGGKITGVITSSAIIGFGLLGKSAATIAAILAGIGGSMVGGVVLIAALPFLGGAFDKIKDIFSKNKVSLEKIMRKKEQYFKDNQEKTLELARRLENTSTEFNKIMSE